MIQRLMKQFCRSALVVIGSTSLGWAESASFQVPPGETLAVDWQGKPLIVRDQLDAVPSSKLDQPEGEHRSEKEGVAIYNRWKVSDPHGQVTWRRETAVRDGGKEVEMTIIYRIPSYYYEGKDEKLDSFYRFSIDLKRFEGGAFRAWVAKGTSYHEVKGRVENGALVPPLNDRVNWLTLEEPNGGKAVSLSLGPHGVTSFNSHVGPNSLPESWWVKAEGGELRFAIGRFKSSMTPHNGIYMGKIVIREVGFGAYDRYHAYNNYLYFQKVPPYRQYHFGRNAREGVAYAPIDPMLWRNEKSREWQEIGLSDYEPRLGAGWLSKGEAALFGKMEDGVLHGGAKGRGDAVLRLDLPDSGIYIFTVRVAAGEKAIGPFSLQTGNQIAAKDLVVEPQKVKTLTFARSIKDGVAELKFSGDWQVNTVAIQKLIHTSEDFAFDRGLWLDETLPAPTQLYTFDRPPIPALAAVQSQPATKGSGKKAGVMPPRERIAFSTNDPKESWRWTSDINGLGPARGNMREFETDAQITRRLDELKERGFEVMLINPQLIRHAIPEEHAAIRQIMKRIAEHAHERGMKIIDHFDVTIVPNMGAAYQEFVQNLDWAQRSVRTGQITRGYCIVNPNFQKHFIDMMVAYVKESNIDGMMLDEVCWHHEAYCGCEHCREKFHQDTALELPSDAEHPDLLNHNSRLWKEWLRWRIKAQGDFCVDLLKAIREVHPNFTWMKYGAPTVYLSDYSTVRSGIALSEATRMSNYFGIEILSTNLHASYRSNLASSAVFNSMTQGEDIGAFGLVYHRHNPSIAYAGWAQNNMSRQRTWFTYGNHEIELDSPRYTRWADNMPLEHVAQQADVGVWFSEQTRDYSEAKKAAMEELMGVCEQLDDLHIPYEVLQEARITAERLANYKVVILPHNAAMSEAQQALIESYLRSGGKILATGLSTRQDELGFAHSEWKIGEWLGIKDEGKLVENAVVTLPGVSSEQAARTLLLQAPVVTATLQKGAAEVLHSFAKPVGEHPAVMRTTVGKGEIVWSAILLGSENFEHDARNNTRPVFGRSNPLSRRLFGELVSGLVGEKPRFQPLFIPPKVAVRHYETTSLAKEGPQSYIHLYNGTGSKFVLNKPTPRETPAVAYPRIMREMTFEVSLPFSGEAEAHYVTPDTPEVTPISLERVGAEEEQRWKARIPARTVEAYGMVRFRKKTD